MFSEELVQFAAKSNMPAYVVIGDLACIDGHPLQPEAQDIQDISRRDHTINKLLGRDVARLRLTALRQSHASARPAPYNHPDLADLPIDKHGLIEPSLFDQTAGGFANGESVFEILPSIAAPNSSHWTWLTLSSLGDRVRPRIRLDPLMHSPRAGYRAMFYKMFVFGQPLSWGKILDLPGESPHRWMPNWPDSADVAFTDAVWTPRECEVHLRCEECPKPAASDYRASRYFHSIVDRKSETIVHCDGALRIFTQDEAVNRNKMHVRDAGKLGTRVKLFQIDEELDAESWGQLFKTFFVWNADIEAYADDLATTSRK